MGQLRVEGQCSIILKLLRFGAKPVPCHSSPGAQCKRRASACDLAWFARKCRTVGMSSVTRARDVPPEDLADFAGTDCDSCADSSFSTGGGDGSGIPTILLEVLVTHALTGTKLLN